MLKEVVKFLLVSICIIVVIIEGLKYDIVWLWGIFFVGYYMFILFIFTFEKKLENEILKILIK